MRYTHSMRRSQLDRYMFRQLLLALVATTGGLVALIWLTQSLRFVELVVNRGLSFAVFLRLTGLLVPNFVAVILPITTFVCVQFVYQRLAGDRELTVMRSAGLSPWALSRPALGLAAGVVGMMYLLTIWVVPVSYSAFREYQFEIRNRLAAFLLQEGVFTPISDDLTIYVRARDTDGTLRGILVEDARQRDSRATILAQRGRLVDTPSGPGLLLQSASRQEIDRKTGRLNVLTFDETTLDLASNSAKGDVRYRDATEMSLGELLAPGGTSTTPRDAGKFVVEAHRRLTAPLTAASFAMVALLSVLTGAFQRHGTVLRPVVAVGAVVALLAVGLGLANLAARQTALVPLMWVHAIVPGLLCGWFLLGPQRASRTRPVRLQPRRLQPGPVQGGRA